ncbi:hypothetical protein FF38_04609 [Lucilia cuprina]|uniref:SH3 domain-containing protein n=1 Tax=Lucilia cuprina TaxID=7375 RepID=A0A0L0BWC6_LUCCU|nr:SH3 domain-containing protein 19 [Lucilia cuprina]KNC24328.1 hypothetical protein FF38_04609 [Lucilia cuprina]
MTLPTRPAPAPPGSRAQNAAANANASLEQLRLQLQQQQQLQRQQQNVTVPKLTIKLPPPPKQPLATNVYNGGSGGSINNNTGSITRKFPQARYAPATNWDDSPFDILAGNSTGFGGGMATKSQTQATTNGNYKKQPPPRPPPPKVQPKKGAAPTPPTQQSTNILTNIFHLKKKSSKAPTPNNSASRIYGSATYGTTTSTTGTSKSNTTSLQTNGFSHTSSLTTDWNSAWNTTASSTMQTTHQTAATTEAQLISFDSPPSSPTFTQKSNSDCLSVDSFSSDSNFSSPNNGSVSQPESGFEDDFSASAGRSRPATTSPLDPWEALDAFGHSEATAATTTQPRYGSIGTAPVRNLSTINTRLQNNGDNPLCNGKSLLPPAPTLNMPTIIKPKISQKPKAPKPPLLAKPSAFGSSSLYSDNLITPPSPPMPQCAPPPPPQTTTSSSFAVSSSTAKPTYSILDVITGKVDAIHLSSGMDDYNSEPLEPPHGIALYDFDSTEEGDLCFRENEKIYLIEKVSEEWYKGRTRSGCEGIFPINYIEIKVPLNSKSTISSENSTQSSSPSTTPTYQQVTPTANSSNLKVRSLYNFPAEVEGDLELKENDLVTILYRINEDWLFGEANGRQGQFPANFLEYVPTNVPMP